MTPLGTTPPFCGSSSRHGAALLLLQTYSASRSVVLVRSSGSKRRRSSSVGGSTSGGVGGFVVGGRKLWIIGGRRGARDARGQLGATAMPQGGDGGEVRVRRNGSGGGGRDLCARCVAERNEDEHSGGPVANGHSVLGGGRTGSEKKLLTLPTILTLTRVAAVPALLAVFYSQEKWATTAGATIFVLAAVTDWLDGYLARKMGSSSEFGAFLDPVADKLMVATTLVLLCTRPPTAELAKVAPWLLPLPAIAIIGREITMSALREWAASQGGDIHKAVAVNNLGKWKTAAQMVALTLLLVTRDGGGGVALGAAGISLLYVAAGLALWSLAVYIKAMWKRLAR